MFLEPELSIDQNSFLFSSKVYPECSTQQCNESKDTERKESKVKAEIFTELMYRHWDDWRGPKISHLFLFNLKDKTYSDLNLNSKFDVPPLALGSSKDFAFSPTGTEVAFSMNEDEFLATSTNNDIFILDITELKNNSYKKISLGSGNDNHPVYSPDGNYLAYLSMERAGFEADKQRIMLYNRVTEETINLSGNYDLSASQIVWAKDSKSIYFTAANKIYNSIYNIDVKSKLISTIVESVVASSLQLSSDGKTLYFKNQKSTLPDEIFAINTDKLNFRKITDVNGKLLSKIEMNNVETFLVRRC